ncbi:hypothetical protein OAV82_01100 [Candidatus Pelagibacter sp.]|nr:hypothetical protein [Candidatus Pelagibacter sp.]
MKKILGIIALGLLLSTSVNASTYGQGKIKLSDYVLDALINYLNPDAVHNETQGSRQKGIPMNFAVSVSGVGHSYTYCPRGMNCAPSTGRLLTDCKKRSNEKCYVFARGRKIVWDGINYKFKRKVSALEIKSKLEEWGFIGNSISSTTTTTPKITKKKKEPKKIVKKYELKGERSIALSWEGYEELIAGTVNFDETDYKGTLNLPLPNNDGTCDGTYSLQKGGKGTWQIACSNNMGAAGTLKWVKDGGVTGTGRDHNDKKVKFTVSKNS